ncbi:Serine/threonine protein kinase [Micromonospora nigra]|uniref:Serine/threonine protein kinase n=1 Tax=Micromonospora nigra TaxID=145857 RepID=A0A1C6RD40_9ACTN|nr:protein kinase [Micromonospora nigra]SCL15067.1 Serine/threonine protein kinase [Micromonospora nigra]
MSTEGSAWPSSVRAASNNLHLDLLLDNQLGSGGEGAVFRTRYGGLAVKLCAPDDSSRDRMTELFARLRWLPLDGIPLCRPLEQLAPPHVGYVMELLEDMVPLRELCDPPQQDEDAWYLGGGGLRRRLVLLARCADVLATLHDRGIVYSDVSPGNVLVSSDLGHDEVRLIDADNLQTESSTATRRLGTPFYTAPELLRGQSGNTVFSDVYSFAVLAYEVLTMNHPLIGDYVNEGEVELEDDAQRGLVPWIDHSTDDRNRTRFGYPADRVLTRRLRDLFRRTFEEGMTDPWARPGAGEWAAALHAAADRCLVCPCGQSFLAAHPTCPWCRAARPPALTVTVLEQFPRLTEGPPPLLPQDDLTLVLQAHRPLLVTNRTAVRHPEDPTVALLRMEWDGGAEVRVRNCGRSIVRRVPPQGGNGLQLIPGSAAVEHLRAPWWIHFDTELRPHRILVLQSIEAPDAR